MSRAVNPMSLQRFLEIMINKGMPVVGVSYWAGGSHIKREIIKFSSSNGYCNALVKVGSETFPLNNGTLGNLKVISVRVMDMMAVRPRKRVVGGADMQWYLRVSS
jgi:hypothetical protein